jgi:hypothetical protein
MAGRAGAGAAALALVIAGLAVGLSQTGSATAHTQTVEAAVVTPDLTYDPSDTVKPVLAYNFDNDSGTSVTDASGNGYNGAWTGTAAYVAGVSGNAAHVTAGHNIKLPLVSGVTDGSGSYSFEFWIKENSYTGDSWVFANENGGSCEQNGLGLYNNSGSNGVLTGCYAASGVHVGLGNAPIVGGWHMLAAVIDRSAGTVTWYDDGFQAGPVTNFASSISMDSGLPFVLGQSGAVNYTQNVDAYFDDVNFYDQAISAAQVKADFGATNPNPGDVAAGFVTSTFHAPQVQVGGTVRQPLSGLWNGDAPTTYTKVSGDSWLSVGADGTVTGTAPKAAPQHPGSITVQTTNGTQTSQIRVEVPVISANDAPQLTTATWNLWDAGSHVKASLFKDLAVIANSGLDVIGVQEDGGAVAQQLATALGWYDYESADGLGIVSAYPISADKVVDATAAAPATGVTVTVDGKAIRVWDAGLDPSDSATPDAQAQAVAAEVKRDETGSAPVILLGDLESSSEESAFTRAGLTDSFRQANPNATADPGNTLLFTSPSGRVDYINYAGNGLKLTGSDTLVAGWPTQATAATGAWTSDHAAVVSTFSLAHQPQHGQGDGH